MFEAILNSFSSGFCLNDDHYECDETMKMERRCRDIERGFESDQAEWPQLGVRGPCLRMLPERVGMDPCGVRILVALFGLLDADFASLDRRLMNHLWIELGWERGRRQQASGRRRGRAEAIRYLALLRSRLADRRRFLVGATRFDVPWPQPDCLNRIHSFAIVRIPQNRSEL